MANYQEQFNLDIDDIALIEDASRNSLASTLAQTPGGPAYASNPHERQINALLGKIHNQKIFYSVVATENVPLG